MRILLTFKLHWRKKKKKSANKSEQETLTYMGHSTHAKQLFRDSLLEICRQNPTAFNKLKFLNLWWQVSTTNIFSHTCIDIRSAITIWSAIDKLPFCSVQQWSLHYITSHKWKISVLKCLLHVQVWRRMTNSKSFGKAMCTDRTMYFEYIGFTRQPISWGGGKWSRVPTKHVSQ